MFGYLNETPFAFNRPCKENPSIALLLSSFFSLLLMVSRLLRNGYGARWPTFVFRDGVRRTKECVHRKLYSNLLTVRQEIPESQKRVVAGGTGPPTRLRIPTAHPEGPDFRPWKLRFWGPVEIRSASEKTLRAGWRKLTGRPTVEQEFRIYL